MQDNIIYSLMTDKEGIKNDVKDALEMVTNLFKHKYMDKIAYEVNRRQTEIINNPTKEVQLLNTLKLFADNETAENMNKIINTMNRINTIINIKSENDRLIKALSDESVKKDGVYDIDESCIRAANSSSDSFPFLLLLMCLFIK